MRSQVGARWLANERSRERVGPTMKRPAIYRLGESEKNKAKLEKIYQWLRVGAFISKREIQSPSIAVINRILAKLQQPN